MEVFLIILLVLLLSLLYYKEKQYKDGTYYQVTKNPHSSVKHDKGKYAEYITYASLRHFENYGGKFLFNIIIPKKSGGVTEIDVLLICSKGLIVLECKNYGGWIFGNETQKNWTQTLPQGRGRCHKEYFYNPIMQNASHIRHLKNLVGKNILMHSIIVFSDRCVLKNITIKSTNISVINHCSVVSVVSQIWNRTQSEFYTEAEISNIYNKLYPYTQLDYAAKEQHVKSIERIRLNSHNHASSNRLYQIAES